MDKRMSVTWSHFLCALEMRISDSPQVGIEDGAHHNASHPAHCNMTPSDPVIFMLESKAC